MRQGAILFILLLTMPAFLWADKIIMKDGKIYQGHIMGETDHSILISNPPLDPKPRFIELKDVLTIVRESRPAEKPSAEEQRFASVSAGLTGNVYSAGPFFLAPAPGLYFGGGFRLHPSIELGGEFNVNPNLSGRTLTVTNKLAPQDSRSYQDYYSYNGGFSAKFFPFYKFRQWRMEPYMITGYHWDRLTPKGSGDEFKGTSIFGGLGVMIPWWKPLYWDFRFLYGHTSYDSIQFLTGEGDLSGVTNNTYSFSAGLSYRFL